MIDIKHTKEYADLKQKFDVYYANKLLPILENSNKIRIRYVLTFVLLLFLTLVFYPAVLYFLLSGYMRGSAVGIILALSGGVIMLACGPFYYCRKKVKPRIMPDFANFFGSFSYAYQGKIDDAFLRQSDLFAPYNQSIGDDCFSGIYNGVRISIAEEKLQQVKRDFRNLEVKKKVFGGVCILFEMNKNFKGRTVVLKDRGFLGNAVNKIAGLQNVKLEDSRFEKYFEVYADDQIEARYLLTTAFMERMLKLRDLYGGKSIQFCFYQNTLLLAITTGQNMFEAQSFFRSNSDKKKIDLVFEQFYTVFSIVDLLKLNQRIGM